MKDEYSMLNNKLSLIKNKLSKLKDNYDEMITVTKESFIVDDKVIYEEEFEKIRINLNVYEDELVNRIIPSMNNKI